MSAIREMFARPLAGRISANIGWLLGEKCVRIVSSVAVGIWVARHLGAEAFGVLSYCLAILALFGCAGTLGTDIILKRELLRQPADAESLVGSVVFLRVFAAFVAILTASVWSFWFMDPEDRGVLFFAGGSLLLPLLSTPDLFLQANLKGRASFGAGVAATLVGAAGRVVCILVDAPLEAFGAMVSVETLVMGGVLWGRLRASGIQVRRSSFDAGLALQLLRDSLPLLVGGIAVTVYSRIDQVMLESMRGAAEVGIYSAAVRISEMVNFVPMVLAAGLFPSLVTASVGSRQEFLRRTGLFFDLNAAVAYAFVLPVAMLARPIVSLVFSDAFDGAGPVLAVHAWSVLFVFLGVARGQVLTVEGIIKFQTVATVAGAAVNVGLNSLLIPSHGAVGAAWATVAAYAIAAWVSGCFYHRIHAAFLMQVRALLVPLLGWRHLFRR